MPLEERWDAAGRIPNSRTPALLLAGVVVLALVLRFWSLGEWNFQATEMFTLKDSQRPQFRNPRPLGYLLTYYLVRPFHQLDEFWLRLLPAIFGVLAVPALYWMTRRLIGQRAALFAALFLAVSPLHIMYSQLARYWSLAFLFSIIYPFAFYLGLRDRSPRYLVLGVVTAILAVLAHPVSALVIGGPLLLLASRLRTEHLAQAWRQRSVRWGLPVLALLAGAALLRLVPILQSWISQHDKNPGSGQFLLRTPPPPGVKQILNLAAFGEGLTAPLALLGVLGIYLLWRDRDRLLALFLASLALFPLVFLSLISLRTPISQYYFLPTISVYFIGAGIFVDRLFGCDFRPRWLVPSTVAALLIAAGAPTLISDYRDGRRFDFRGVARWLETRLQPGDLVFSDQPMVLAYYLSGTYDLSATPVQRLRRPEPLDQTLRDLSRAGAGKALWVVAPAPSHAFRANLKRGGLSFWIYDNCQLRNSVGVGRVDLRQDYLHVYRCPPASPPMKSGDGSSSRSE